MREIERWVGLRGYKERESTKDRGDESRYGEIQGNMG